MASVIHIYLKKTRFYWRFIGGTLCVATDVQFGLLGHYAKMKEIKKIKN